MTVGPTLLDILAVCVAAISAAAVWYLTSRSPQTDRSIPVPAKPASLGLRFEFDTNGTFLHANEAGDRFLRDLKLDGADWHNLRNALIDRFPGIPSQHMTCGVSRFERYDAVSPADPAQIAFDMHDTGFCVHLSPQQNLSVALTCETHRIFSNIGDVSLVRAAGERAPFPIWQQRPDGKVAWANTAYQSLVDDYEPKNGRALFEICETPDMSKPVRICLRSKDRSTAPKWFSVQGRAFEGGTLNFAYDIAETIEAEAARRSFVQTLAKTFAHLSTGLAIFNRDRELVMFNPSLIELTHLPADFLTKRPNLFAVFDQLRNNNVMPEPKNYKNWRDRMVAVMTQAENDDFAEIWTLPSSQTYRITGRPHPDGAIAFLFEDISAEVSLTRKFRGEMDVTQSALNALPDGIAIFSPTGTMVQCNQAMMRDWDLPDASEEEPLDITRTSHLLQKRCKPSPIWGELRDFVCNVTERAAWTAQAVRKDGQQVEVSVNPIAAGASLVTLHVSAEVTRIHQKEEARIAAA